jgi:pyruvate/oxaloacetate carboxyltransferase/biotin carboxyl carrier protein
MSTDMIAPIAAMMDRVGYKSVTTVGSNGYVVQSRYYGEDPWGRLRLLSQEMPHTDIRGSYMTASLASFDIDTPQDVIALWIKRSVANGATSFWVCDYQTDDDRFRYFAEIAKELGADVVTSLMYTSSPAHDQEHWARKTRQIAALRDCVDAVMIEDASGVLTPEATRELLATVQANGDGLPIEFHMHCTSGLAPLCYLEAIKMGVDAVHTAIAPLANGSSLPATESILRNAARLGYAADLDEEALAAVSSHFRAIAEERGLPIGAPEEYDLFHYEHQVPGGMITNLTRQLKEAGMVDRLQEVLEEVVHVRRELGYPVMATPYSQIVGVQALENVVSGERYKKVPDTVVKYLLGFYGEPAGPVDPDVRDRIFSLPEAKKLAEWQPQGRYRPLEDLRAEAGPDLTDDELLLRLVIPGWRPGAARARSDGGAAAGAPNGAARPAARPSAAPAPGAPSRGAPAAPGDGAAVVGAAPTASGGRMAFTVEVDGEVFDVKVTPAAGDTEGGPEVRMGPAAAAAPPDGGAGPAAAARGASAPGTVPVVAAGLVVSVAVAPGDTVREGDVIAAIEAMKLIRELTAPHGGVVREVHVAAGDLVEADDPLMVIERVE